MKRFLIFTLAGLFTTTLLVFSETDSGYGDRIPYVFAYANADSLRYTGDDVKAFQSALLNNYSDREDVSYAWRFRLQLTEVDEDGELGDLIRESVEDGSGAVRNGNGWHTYRYMSVPAQGLMERTEYGIKTYTRLTVTGRVRTGGRTVTRTEDWFVDPTATFRAR